MDELESEWVENTKDIPNFNFDKENCGIKLDVTATSTPREVFDFIFCKEIMELIINSTKEYGRKLCTNRGIKTRHSRLATFKPTTIKEMYQFLGLCLLQGEIKVPRIRYLFSRNTLSFHPVFQLQYQGDALSSFFSCFGCNDIDGDEHKLKKIQPLVKLLIESFQRANVPEEELSLDGSLILFRGRLSFRQYIKRKKG